MPASTDLVRWVIPAILLVSAGGVLLSLVWERIRPSVPVHVAEMRAWRGMSTQEQAAADVQAMQEAAFWEHEAVVRAGAEESARLAVQRAAEINVQYHP